MNNKLEGFLMNAEMAMEFFQRCNASNAKTLEERTAILHAMQKELKVVKLDEKAIKNQIRGKRLLQIKYQKDK